MKLYIVSLFQPNTISERIIKAFSTKENLEKWIECARLMDKELFGDRGFDVTKDYKIHEVEMDNLDFVSLLAEARGLGANVKPSQP